jgi:hypothetical protein
MRTHRVVLRSNSVAKRSIRFLSSRPPWSALSSPRQTFNTCRRNAGNSIVERNRTFSGSSDSDARRALRHAVGDGRAAGLQHPHYGRGARRREPGARGVHRPGPARAARLHGFPVLMVEQDDKDEQDSAPDRRYAKEIDRAPRDDVIRERPTSAVGLRPRNPRRAAAAASVSHPPGS